MDNLTEKEDVTIQVRDKLRKDGIKLWLNPYFNEENGSLETEIKNLGESISASLNVPLDICTEVLKELQQKSLENLKQKNAYQQSGVATLKIKIIEEGQLPKLIPMEIVLSCRGCDLREMIGKNISVDANRLKLICSGKVLSNVDPLTTQGVNNGSQILAIILAATPDEVKKTENAFKMLENIKSDSKLLALDHEYMALEDQYGNAIKIPKQEKQALIVAMTLHEKGRTALKKEDYAAALVFLLEADEEFKNCSSTLLKSVDNYALLDLDIAWCYLCLQSITHLPEAQDRLKRCDEQFQKTYGTQFERLIALKGSAGNEACLLARLHLLQAIVLYHQNRRTESLALLKKVELELSRLKTDDASVTKLVEFGYSIAEARIGLRATGGDINSAANYLNDLRQKRTESRKKAVVEALFEKEQHRLGKCVDGEQYVNPNFLNILVNMGYNKEVATIALRNCNNIISDSVQYIQQNPVAGPSASKSTEFKSLINDLIPLLTAAGFDPRMAQIALNKHEGDIMKAAEELLANNGMVLGDLSALDLISSESVEKIKTKSKEHKQKNDAFKRLKEDMATEDDDYLDTNLDQEEIFLKQYLSLLEK